MGTVGWDREWRNLHQLAPFPNWCFSTKITHATKWKTRPTDLVTPHTNLSAFRAKDSERQSTCNFCLFGEGDERLRICAVGIRQNGSGCSFEHADKRAVSVVVEKLLHRGFSPRNHSQPWHNLHEVYRFRLSLIDHKRSELSNRSSDHCLYQDRGRTPNSRHQSHGAVSSGERAQKQQDRQTNFMQKLTRGSMSTMAVSRRLIQNIRLPISFKMLRVSVLYSYPIAQDNCSLKIFKQPAKITSSPNFWGWLDLWTTARTNLV